MLTAEEKERVAELHKEIWDEEHSGKNGFSPKLIKLTREMQGLFMKQEEKEEME